MKLSEFINDLIDIPKHKLKYVLETDFVKGLRDSISNCGVKYTEKVHEKLVEAVQKRLMDGADVEYDWTEKQYENFVCWKPEYEK